MSSTTVLIAIGILLCCSAGPWSPLVGAQQNFFFFNQQPTGDGPLNQQPTALPATSDAPPPPPPTTAAPAVTTTTPSPAFIACLANCPTTTEYNPVCGSDTVSYNNPQRLSCANVCGPRVYGGQWTPVVSNGRGVCQAASESIASLG